MIAETYINGAFHFGASLARNGTHTWLEAYEAGLEFADAIWHGAAEGRGFTEGEKAQFAALVRAGFQAERTGSDIAGHLGGEFVVEPVAVGRALVIEPISGEVMGVLQHFSTAEGPAFAMLDGDGVAVAQGATPAEALGIRPAAFA